MNIEKLTTDLIADEAVKLKPYKDSVGVLTIGAGRNLDDKGISYSEALMLLNNDINETFVELFKKFPWMSQLNEVRQNVFLNMAFNLGVDGLAKFKLALAYAQGDRFDWVAKEMLDSQWAQQVGGRAQRLAQEMKTGEFQNVGKN